jgi:hypothetical protein
MSRGVAEKDTLEVMTFTATSLCPRKPTFACGAKSVALGHERYFAPQKTASFSLLDHPVLAWTAGGNETPSLATKW